MLATVCTLALGLAGPALGADDPLPIPQIPSTPDGATSALAAPTDSALPPALEPPSPPPITVTVDTDGSDIDVSVRVLSPGEDATQPRDSAEPSLVSGSKDTSITADQAPAPELPGASVGGTEETGTDVTVSIPGADGNRPATDTESLAGKSAAPATKGSTADDSTISVEQAPDIAAEASNHATISPTQSEQYHERDSQYQSERQFGDDAWIWQWYLSLDCDGTPTSSSNESGDPSSRDWTWEWTWEWACGSPPHPPAVDTLEDSAAASEPTTAPQGASTEGSTPAAPAGAGARGEDAAPEPWLWSWTFTFCGESVTMTLPIRTKTELQWVWEWIWIWTCGPAATPAPATPMPANQGPAPNPPTDAPTPTPVSDGAASPAGDAQPQLPGIPGVELPAWLTSLLPLGGRAGGSSAHVGVTTLLETPTVSVVVDLDVPSIAVSANPAPKDGLGTPATLDPSVISPTAPPQPVRGAISNEQGVVGGSWVTRPRQARPSEPRVSKAPARTKRHATTSRSGRPPLPPWPPLRLFQAAGAPGASSSPAPGGSAVGAAALVALFILAAPELRRRIRVARELRPRGTYGSSIEHPG